MNLYAVEAGNFKLDGGAMFGVVPKVLWERTNPADANNQIEKPKSQCQNLRSMSGVRKLHEGDRKGCYHGAKSKVTETDQIKTVRFTDERHHFRHDLLGSRSRAS